MQTDEATLAPNTLGPSERPNRTGPEPAGPGAVEAGAEHATKVHGSGETALSPEHQEAPRRGSAILNEQDIGQAQRATSALLGTVLAEHGTRLDRWVLLNALATGAFPPERARLVPGLAAALATGPAAVESMLDQAEVAGLARIVSALGGDPGAVRAELTAAGVTQHRTLRSAIDQVADELYAGIPEHDLAAAHRVLAEVTWRADGWMQLWTATTAAVPAR